MRMLSGSILMVAVAIVAAAFLLRSPSVRINPDKEPLLFLLFVVLPVLVAGLGLFLIVTGMRGRPPD